MILVVTHAIMVSVTRGFSNCLLPILTEVTIFKNIVSTTMHSLKVLSHGKTMLTNPDRNLSFKRSLHGYS